MDKKLDSDMPGPGIAHALRLKIAAMDSPAACDGRNLGSHDFAVTAG